VRYLAAGEADSMLMWAHTTLIFTRIPMRCTQRGRGLAIDPNPQLALLFKWFRPRDKFICAGIGKGTMSYHIYKQGAWNGFKEVDRSTLVGKFPVVLRSLSEILQENGVKNIDLLNVDVEGMDLEVIRSHDWSIKPTIVVVETAPGSPIQVFLED
jgi:FkbM family methyltransferase